jgi:outer membrane protein assembly factor BamB
VDTAPAVANGLVYVGSDDDSVYALDARTGALQWKYTTGSVVLSSPMVANGVVYVGSVFEDKLYALDAGTGAQLWQYTTWSYVSSSPVVADGVLYFGSSDKNLYAFHLPGQ